MQNPQNFIKVKTNEEIFCPQGKVHVLCSSQATVFTGTPKDQTILGIGTEIKAKGTFETITVKAPKNAEAYLYWPSEINHRPVGEILTNMDRMPMESGSLLEIKRAIRQQAIDAKFGEQARKSQTRLQKALMKVADDEREATIAAHKAAEEQAEKETAEDAAKLEAEEKAAAEKAEAELSKGDIPSGVG